MPSNRLPDRWENYSNIGDVIPGTRLITFKVPLAEHYCRRYSEELWFTPETLLELTDSRNINLGLVIDLTFTSRYYDKTRFTSQGVQYEKIFVPGHEIPANNIIKRFFTVIDKFLEENADNDKVVGVHCTHGVNRTGYVVCRYMIERLGIKPEEAIEACGKARGYPVERENYLEDLKERPKEPEQENEDADRNDNCATNSSEKSFHPTQVDINKQKGRKHSHKDRHNGYSRNTASYGTDRNGQDSSNYSSHAKRSRYNSYQDNRTSDRNWSELPFYRSQYPEDYLSNQPVWQNQQPFFQPQQHGRYQSKQSVWHHKNPGSYQSKRGQSSRGGYQSPSGSSHSNFSNSYSDFGSYNYHSGNDSYPSRPRGRRYNNNSYQSRHASYQSHSDRSHDVHNGSQSEDKNSSDLSKQIGLSQETKHSFPS